MKNFKVFIILLLVITGLTNCKKTNDPAPVAAATKIDGVEFKPSNQTANASTSGQTTLVFIDNTTTVTLALSGKDVGTYAITSKKRLNTASATLVKSGITYTAVSGTITISVSGTSISGTFSFTATSSTNVTISLSDGSFANIPITINTGSGGTSSALFNPAKTYGTMTDQDGNTYKTITIGTQTWMAENLRTTKYRDGSTIPNVTYNWGSLLAEGAYCNYKYAKDADTIATYGRLYNWYAATDKRNIAPTGWHVPTDAEWTTLTTFLGGEDIAGGKMKETGTSHWVSPNTGATNESGFTCLPSGLRTKELYHSNFTNLGGYVGYWSSTYFGYAKAWHRSLVFDNADCHRGSTNVDFGFSLRLVKD